MEQDNFAVIVPTLNAAGTWPEFSNALLAQRIDPRCVLVMDSSSNDGTGELAARAGFRVVTIAREEFNHGGTRQLALDYAKNAKIIVYLTQDAILADAQALPSLLTAFDDSEVGIAYGRQLPRPGAGPIEAHSRLFNYPARSEMRSLSSKDTLGFKAIFVSNSFAAYRRAALQAVGGFPEDVIFGEDTVTAARMLMKQWKLAYVAEAHVYHSHEYSLQQEFRRYFDIGVLHAREPWMIEEFGHAGGEGKRYVISELKYLWPRHAALIPSAIMRTAAKLAGYRLGRGEARLSRETKLRLSMHRSFWLQGES